MRARAVRLALCLAVMAVVRGEGEGESEEARNAEAGERAPVDEAVAFNEEGFDPAHVLSFFVPPREQECFYHVVESSSENLRIAFFVSDGGDMKLDALFKDAAGNVVYDRRSVDEGLFEFVAKDEGTYSFCFDNHRNTDSRTMTFALHVGDRPSNEPPALPEHMEPLGDQISRLRDFVDDVSTQLSLHAARLKRHIQTQASTESRIFYFTAAESAFIVCLSITQAVVVRRFLNNRQWV